MISKSAIQDMIDTVQSPAMMRSIIGQLERRPPSPKLEEALALARSALAQLAARPERLPSEDLLERIASGEIPDPFATADGDAYAALLEQAWKTRLCPRDGQPLALRVNTRAPELGSEIYCSCGFMCSE